MLVLLLLEYTLTVSSPAPEQNITLLLLGHELPILRLNPSDEHPEAGSELLPEGHLLDTNLL